VAALVAGCGIDDAYPPTDEAPGGGPADALEAQVVPPPEEPADVRPLDDPRGAGSASGAATAYARASSNWTWRNIADINRTVLAELSAGRLQRDALHNAADLRDDVHLRRSQSANRGQVLAVDVQGSEPGRRTVWIVMNETASAGGLTGLGDTRTTVYRAVVELRADDRWFVTSFEGQG
jgi:hypothetical protein